jgi:hypothetical protein
MLRGCTPLRSSNLRDEPLDASLCFFQVSGRRAGARLGCVSAPAVRLRSSSSRTTCRAARRHLAAARRKTLARGDSFSSQVSALDVCSSWVRASVMRNDTCFGSVSATADQSQRASLHLPSRVERAIHVDVSGAQRRASASRSMVMRQQVRPNRSTKFGDRWCSGARIITMRTSPITGDVGFESARAGQARMGSQTFSQTWGTDRLVGTGRGPSIRSSAKTTTGTTSLGTFGGRRIASKRSTDDQRTRNDLAMN